MSRRLIRAKRAAVSIYLGRCSLFGDFFKDLFGAFWEVVKTAWEVFGVSKGKAKDKYAKHRAKLDAN